ncbi:hypothetical protein JI667_12700 [Bacillus sp. NTK074B]|uniref:hypothetical protein n=1 Tax=Bacillus sp. NTK074B TaxID=2802174 RepID=UPI001A8E2437|nr:hypothetical protein [Bacillus sp. NTK074B]
MKKYQLKRDFRGVKKGTRFYMVVESEYIGIKEYVVRTQDFSIRMIISEREMDHYFFRVN